MIFYLIFLLLLKMHYYLTTFFFFLNVTEPQAFALECDLNCHKKHSGITSLFNDNHFDVCIFCNYLKSVLYSVELLI